MIRNISSQGTEKGQFGTGIVGPRQTGKSTLVGLLDQTLLKYAIGFSRTPTQKEKGLLVLTHSTEVLKVGQITSKMTTSEGKGGKFPDPTPPAQREYIRIYVGFREEIGWWDRVRETLGNFTKREKDDFEKVLKDLNQQLDQTGANPQDYKYTVIRIADLSGEDVQEFMDECQRIGVEKAYNNNPMMKEVLSVKCPIFLFDCSYFNYYKDNFNVLDKYDMDMSVLLLSFIEYRNMSGQFNVKPAYMFTKCDLLSKEIKEELGFNEIEALKDKDYDTAAKVAQEVGEKMLKKYMRRTHRAIVGAKIGGVALASGRSFFSWVETEQRDTLKVTGAHYNIFSDWEYLRLLQFIRNNIEPMDSCEAAMEYARPLIR